MSGGVGGLRLGGAIGGVVVGSRRSGIVCYHRGIGDFFSSLLPRNKSHGDSEPRLKCCFGSPSSPNRSSVSTSCQGFLFKRPVASSPPCYNNVLLKSGHHHHHYFLRRNLYNYISSQQVCVLGQGSPRNHLQEREQQTALARDLFQLRKSHFSTSSTTIDKTMSNNGSLARQNYHEECEAHINKQINMELYASYVYMSMAYYFDRDDVALPGFYKFFKKSSDEEREHAEKFMKYQNTRGGRIILQAVAKPTRDEWDSPLDAVTAALELEKTVNHTLLDIHAVAGRNNDPQLCDFLETNFLEEQIKSIKELSDFVCRLKRCGKGLGEFIFDKELGEEN